jgi:abelson tyrosine-protein kinase 1
VYVVLFIAFFFERVEADILSGLLVTLPLWSPAPVALGAVGYLSKPSGTFVTLFNAFDPIKSSGGVVKGMPSVHGFGKVSQGSQRQEKRSIAQKGLDAISGFLTFKNKGEGPVS